MTDSVPAHTSPARMALGFPAGFLGTLTFHQIAVAALWAADIAPFSPYNMAPTAPLGVPAVISLAFWGGVWGVLYGFADSRFPHGPVYWVAAFAFGAVLPTLVALLIVARLKGGLPAGADLATLWYTAFAVNGIWGIGTGAFLRLFARGLRRRQRRTE